MKAVITRGLLYLMLIAFALYYLMPVYVLIVTSLKPFESVSLTTMWELPKTLYLGSFERAWPMVSNNFWNSVRITVPAAIVSSFIGSFNGYIFAKWRFKGSNWLFLAVLFGMFLPYQGILIPLAQALSAIGLYGTVLGLVSVHVVFGIPITALIFRSYFVTVPEELLEAAKIDGAGFFQIYRSVMLPISAPAFGVALIWQFAQIWNEFLMGVVVLSNPALSPVTVAINNLAGSYFVEWNVQMAGAVIAAAPTVVVYLLLGRLFMRGLLAGALKG